MCSSAAAAPPTESPKLTQAADKQAKLGKSALKDAKKSADAQEALGQDYLDFSKEQFQVSQERQRDIDALSQEISTYFKDIATGDRERYETVFRPLEDEFVKFAQEFDSPEKQAEAAARAKADVHAAAAADQSARERNMASYGIRPDSGRFAGVDRAAGLGTAATSVGAQNAARNEVRDRAIDLKKDAITLGQGTNAQAQAAGGASLTPTLAANEQFMNSQGIVAPGYAAAGAGLQGAAATRDAGYGTAMTGYGSQANAYNDLYRNQIGVWGTQMEADAANAAGFGDALGTAAGIGLSFVSDKKGKKNRKKVPEGEALEAVEGMPVETYDYKPGQGDGGSHVGPMAQDFAAETGQGDGKRINVQDAIGVTMGAVKDLSTKVDRLAEAIGIRPEAPMTATA